MTMQPRRLFDFAQGRLISKRHILGFRSGFGDFKPAFGIAHRRSS